MGDPKTNMGRAEAYGKQAVMTTGQRCKGTTKAGEPCRGFAVGNGGFCFTHDPGRAEERRAARSKGGAARHGRKLRNDHAPVTLASIADLLPLLEQAVNDVLSLENSIARARTIGYLAGVAVRAFEVTELAERIAALEAAIEAVGNEH